MNLLQKIVNYLSPIIESFGLLFSGLAFRLRSQGGLPLVTVVVPMFNESRFINDCLESVQKQRYRNVECVIINDCSTDGSTELANRFCIRDPRFRMVNQPENRGLSSSRNLGLKMAEGKYITFLDADDFIYPDSIWRRVLHLERNIDRHLAGSFCRVIAVPEDASNRSLFLASLLPSPSVQLNFTNSKGDCPFNVHAALLKTDIIRLMGGFDESMKDGAEDWDLWQRMMRHGFVFDPVGGCCGGYRQKSGSMIRSSPGRHLQEAIRLIEKAHADLPESQMVEGVPFVFRRGIGYYGKEITKIRRVIPFATMVWLTGDHAEFDRLINQIPKGSGFYLKKYIDLSMVIDAAIARFHCLSQKEYNSKKSAFLDQKSAIQKAIAQRMSS